MGKTLRVLKLAVIRYPNALGGFSFHQSSELSAHHLLCDEVNLPLRLFVCISHCSDSDSVSIEALDLKPGNSIKFAKGRNYVSHRIRLTRQFSLSLER